MSCTALSTCDKTAYSDWYCALVVAHSCSSCLAYSEYICMSVRHASPCLLIQTGIVLIEHTHTHTTKHNKTARPIRKNCGLVGHARCGLFGLVLCRSCTHSIARPIRNNCVLAVARDWLVGVRSVKRTLLCLWLVDDSSVERTLF